MPTYNTSSNGHLKYPLTSVVKHLIVSQCLRQSIDVGHHHNKLTPGTTGNALPIVHWLTDIALFVVGIVSVVSDIVMNLLKSHCDCPNCHCDCPNPWLVFAACLLLCIVWSGRKCVWNQLHVVLWKCTCHFKYFANSVLHHQLLINPSMIVACCSSCLKCIAFPESLHLLVSYWCDYEFWLPSSYTQQILDFGV